MASSHLRCPAAGQHWPVRRCEEAQQSPHKLLALLSFFLSLVHVHSASSTDHAGSFSAALLLRCHRSDTHFFFLLSQTTQHWRSHAVGQLSTRSPWRWRLHSIHRTRRRRPVAIAAAAAPPSRSLSNECQPASVALSTPHVAHLGYEPATTTASTSPHRVEVLGSTCVAGKKELWRSRADRPACVVRGGRNTPRLHPLHTTDCWDGAGKAAGHTAAALLRHGLCWCCAWPCDGSLSHLCCHNCYWFSEKSKMCSSSKVVLSLSPFFSLFKTSTVFFNHQLNSPLFFFFSFFYYCRRCVLFLFFLLLLLLLFEFLKESKQWWLKSPLAVVLSFFSEFRLLIFLVTVALIPSEKNKKKGRMKYL